MSAPVTNNKKASRFAPVGIIFALLGLVLFAYFVRKAGIDDILAGIRRLGAAFLLVLATSLTRYVVRSFTWIKCVEPPYRLRFRDALAARLMGDALGNIVPLASVAVSEPSKAAFVRHRIPLIVGLSAIALENIFYSLTVVLMILAGSITLLLSFPLKPALRYTTLGALIITALLAPLGFLVIRKQWPFLSGGLSLLASRGIGKSWVEKTIPKATVFEDRIYRFYGRNKRRLVPIFLLELCFHLAGVVEIYTTLWFISDVVAPTLLTAFILESVNRVINVAFKFVPLRLGVDEGGTGMVSAALGLTRAIGVTLAIVRKARDIFWTTIGVLLMLQRGLSFRELDAEAEEEALETRVVADPARAAASDNP